MGCRSAHRSKSLSAGQADDVLTKTAPDRLHAYIVVWLLTGAWTEDLRARRRDHVHLDPDGGPPYLEAWRSVRAHGDTKTRKSRRTLALPGLWVDALGVQRVQQAKDPWVYEVRFFENYRVTHHGDAVYPQPDLRDVRPTGRKQKPRPLSSRSGFPVR